MSCCRTPAVLRLEKIKENQTNDAKKTQFTYAPEMPGAKWNPESIFDYNALAPVPTIPQENMTPVINPDNVINAPAPAAPVDPPLQPGDIGGDFPPPGGVYPISPQFQVPSNPLAPPGYQELLDYDSLQYVNGFYRTQIGKFVRVDQLIGANEIVSRYGYLIGVGINYILLQDPSNGNVYTIDAYNIKFFYVYYNTSSPFLTNNL